MPKDRAENIDRYKIQGGQLNEFEFGQNEGAMSEQERQRGAGEQGVEGLRGAAEPNAPQNVAERIRQVEEAARAKVERRRAKQSRGGGAKKASKKAAKKSAKKPAKKGTTKSAAGKAGGKKGAAKSSGGAKKGAKKGGAKKGGVAKKGSSKKGASKKGGSSGRRGG